VHIIILCKSLQKCICVNSLLTDLDNLVLWLVY